MKSSVSTLAAGLVLAAAAAITTPASAGESTGCWRHLGCVGGPASANSGLRLPAGRRLLRPRRTGVRGRVLHGPASLR